MQFYQNKKKLFQEPNLWLFLCFIDQRDDSWIFLFSCIKSNPIPKLRKAKSHNYTITLTWMHQISFRMWPQRPFTTSNPQHPCSMILNGRRDGVSVVHRIKTDNKEICRRRGCNWCCKYNNLFHNPTRSKLIGVGNLLSSQWPNWAN